MAVRFTRDRLVLYLVITLLYLIHWVHNDHVSNTGELLTSLLNNTWQVIYVVGANLLYFEYGLSYVLSARVSRVLAIVSSILLHLVVFASGLYLWRELGLLGGIYQPAGAITYAATFRFALGVFLVFAVVKLFFDYTQLKYEGKQAELLFLKAQVHPHFLFNTLNNIYALSQYQPQLVSEAVLRLSKILRYHLYETGSSFIGIDKELAILADYIDLEKLRYSENVTISFNTEVDNPSELIPPLLLLPLVENAFKHGVATTRGKRFVDVHCSLRQRQLHFTVKNSSQAAGDDAEPEDHIGLSNFKRRLQLSYRKFNFVAEQRDAVFTAALTINLASHV